MREKVSSPFPQMSHAVTQQLQIWKPFRTRMFNTPDFSTENQFLSRKASPGSPRCLIGVTSPVPLDVFYLILKTNQLLLCFQPKWPGETLGSKPQMQVTATKEMLWAKGEVRGQLVAGCTHRVHRPEHPLSATGGQSEPGRAAQAQWKQTNPGRMTSGGQKGFPSSSISPATSEHPGSLPGVSTDSVTMCGDLSWINGLRRHTHTHKIISFFFFS